MINLLLKTAWLYLPAGLANIAPVLVRKLPFLDKPVSDKLFGRNKTIRGFLAGVSLAILVVFLQMLVYPYFKDYSLISYSIYNFAIIGFLLGFGALAGDLFESYAKRKINIAPSKPLPVFDQIDYIVGANLFLLLYYVPELRIILLSLVIFPVLSFFVKIMGYVMKINKKWY